MDITSVCIVGGSGFVGRALAEQLSAQAIGVRIVTRSRPRAMGLTVLPTVELAIADVHDTAALARCFENMDAVVNLVGILNESRAQTFQSCHVELPRKVAEACHSAGVRQLVHMSALGAADPAPSAYLRSKAAGESAVRAAAGPLPVTIFRPSVIFGPGDRFLNRFALLMRLSPVFPLAGAGARFQPIWVEDVARCIAAAIGDARAFGATYELCGPRAYTLEELVRAVAAILGIRRTVLPLGGALASLQAAVLERLPGKLLTRDNLRSMSVDCVCAGEFPAIFGFQPAPLEAVVPEYLAATSARARYPRYRHHAGR
jgi:uncharacterized protein YbjT (DUF2867 family)